MYRRHLSIIVATSCTAVSLSAIPAAIAQQQQDAERGPAEQAQAIYLEAMTLYRAGKYRTAAKRFEKAYRLFPDSRLLYNIGRSHEATGNASTALKWYLRCAEHPKTNDDLRQKAVRRLRFIEQARARSAAAPPEPSAASTLVVQGRAESNDGPSVTTVSKWVTGGLGLGLLGGGAAMLVLGLADESELDDARTGNGSVSTLTRTQAVELADRAEFRKNTGLILAGTGAAMAIASMILFIADGGDDDDSTASNSAASNGGASTAVSFVPLDGGGAVWLGRSF